MFTSTVDHVVEVDNGDELVNKSNGSVERVWLENSYHVATMDNDRELIEARDDGLSGGAFGPMSGAISRDEVAKVARLARLILD